MQHRHLKCLSYALLICVAYFFSVMTLSAQYDLPTSVSGTCEAKVARNARIDAHNDPMYFGWLYQGQIKTINPTSPQALRFWVRGEGTLKIKITFPATLTLKRIVGGFWDGVNTLTFYRRDVYISDFTQPEIQPDQASSGLFLSGPTPPPPATPTTPAQTTDWATFPPPPFTEDRSERYMWMGGTVVVPLATVPGFYRATYEVTISDYGF